MDYIKEDPRYVQGKKMIKEAKFEEAVEFFSDLLQAWCVIDFFGIVSNYTVLLLMERKVLYALWRGLSMGMHCC